MHSNVLPPAMSKQKGRLDSLTMVCQPVYKKENFEFKPVKLCFKTDLVSHMYIYEDH